LRAGPSHFAASRLGCAGVWSIASLRTNSGQPGRILICAALFSTLGCREESGLAVTFVTFGTLVNLTQSNKVSA
jgi:hypothetical protein